MSQAKQGDTVKVHYTGRLEDGTTFDTSREAEPLEFTIGSGDIIQGFEQAVIGMAPGENKSVTIPSDEAYGPYQQDMVHVVDRKMIPNDIDLEIGMPLRAVQEGDQEIMLTVVDMDEASVTLDANHPLAGKDLVFEIELLDVLEEGAA